MHLAVVTYFLPAGLLIVSNLLMWCRIARLLLQRIPVRKNHEPIKEHLPREEQAVVLLSGSENGPCVTDSSSQHLSASLTTSRSGQFPPLNASMLGSLGCVAVIQLLCTLTCISGALVASWPAGEGDAFTYLYAVVGGVFGIAALSVYVRHEGKLSGRSCLSVGVVKFFKGRVNERTKSQSSMTTDCEKQKQEKDLNFALMTSSVDEPTESGVCNSSSLSFSNLRQAEHARSYWNRKRRKKTRQDLVVNGNETAQTTEGDVPRGIASVTVTGYSPLLLCRQTNCSADGTSLSRSNEHCSQAAERSSTTGSLPRDISSIHPFQQEFPLLNTKILSTFSLEDGLSSTGSCSHPPPRSNCTCFHPMYNSRNSSYDGRSTCSARLRDFEDEDSTMTFSCFQRQNPSSTTTSPFLDWNAANELQASPQNSLNSVYLSPRILKHDFESESARNDDFALYRHVNSPTSPVRRMPGIGGLQSQKSRHDLCVYCSSDGRVVSRNYFLCGSPAKARNGSTLSKHRRHRVRTPYRSKHARKHKDVPCDGFLCEACHDCRCSTHADRNSKCDFVQFSRFSRCGVPIVCHRHCVVSHCSATLNRNTVAQDSDSDTNI